VPIIELVDHRKALLPTAKCQVGDGNPGDIAG